jgi:hypothetical protein
MPPVAPVVLWQTRKSLDVIVRQKAALRDRSTVAHPPLCRTHFIACTQLSDHAGTRMRMRKDCVQVYATQ